MSVRVARKEIILIPSKGYIAKFQSKVTVNS